MYDQVASAITSEVAKTIAASIIIPAFSYGLVKAFHALRMIGAIYKTIMPNGGSGLVDRVRKIEEQVTIIRESQRWRDTVNSSETAMFECDASGHCIHCNIALTEMFGMTLDQMRGYGWLDAMIDSTERDRARVAWETARETNMPYRDTYKVHNRTTGERFFAHAHAYNITDKDGKILSIIGMVDKQKTIRNDNGQMTAASLALPEDPTPLKLHGRVQ